jgi:hypothetical protein
LEKYNKNEGLAKAQFIMAVSESMTLRLDSCTTAKVMWDTLIAEITKKPKMVFTKLERELCIMKCNKEDDLHDHLDKSLDLYAHLNEMGAQISGIVTFWM